MRRVMKFCVEKTAGGARLGTITQQQAGDEVSIPTPTCLLYTKGGSAPNLSRDMVDRISNVTPMVHYPLPHIADHMETLAAFGKGITEFTAMKGFVSYCSYQDSAKTVPPGYSDKHGTSVWTRGGKLKFDVELFMRTQEAIQPDVYQAMCDSNTDRDAGKKRLLKSREATLHFLDKIIEAHQNSQKLANCSIFGSVEGGYSIDDRLWSAKETAKRPVAGFCIEGFHSFGPETENFNMEEIVDILKQTLAVLPSDRPRLMHSVWTPDAVITAVQAGLDMFDTVYPHIVAERGSALVFNFGLPQKSPVTAVEDANTDNTSSHTPGSNGHIKQYPFEINLKDKRYFDDFSPLVADCRCYTCQTHSRSYISHLLNTSELLASTLLVLHNFYHYFEYFKAIRQAMSEDRLDELKQTVCNKTGR